MYRKYGIPLLIILGISLGMGILRDFLVGDFWNNFFVLLNCALLFGFGVSLNYRKKSRSESWVKKVVISFFVIFFLVWEMGYIMMIPNLKEIFNFLGIYGSVIGLVYIYCGWSFFD